MTRNKTVVSSMAIARLRHKLQPRSSPFQGIGPSQWQRMTSKKAILCLDFRSLSKFLLEMPRSSSMVSGVPGSWKSCWESRILGRKWLFCHGGTSPLPASQTKATVACDAPYCPPKWPCLPANPGSSLLQHGHVRQKEPCFLHIPLAMQAMGQNLAILHTYKSKTASFSIDFRDSHLESPGCPTPVTKA